MDMMMTKNELGGIRARILDALKLAFEIHESLGQAGEELIAKNQFGDTALKVDIEIEKAIINYLKETDLNIQLISEEHGTTNVGGKPQFLAIMDGLDGSGVYKEKRSVGRYATMFGIFSGDNPKYQDYLVSGIAEHAAKKIYLAVRGQGSEIIEQNFSQKISTSGQKVLSEKTQIRVDEYFPLNIKIFSEPLRSLGYKTTHDKSSAIYYADVASGKADLALECTRKNNLEIAISYGLIQESGGAIVDIEGRDLGPMLYRQFGQDEQLPIITAATVDLAQDLIKFLKRNKNA